VQKKRKKNLKNKKKNLQDKRYQIKQKSFFLLGLEKTQVKFYNCWHRFYETVSVEICG
jgi:hypothetical protein